MQDADRPSLCQQHREGAPKARFRRVAPLEDNENSLLNNDLVNHPTTANYNDEKELNNDELNAVDQEKKDPESVWVKIDNNYFKFYLVQLLIKVAAQGVWKLSGSPDLTPFLAHPSLIFCAFLEAIVLMSIIIKVFSKNLTTKKRAIKEFYIVSIIKFFLQPVLRDAGFWSVNDISFLFHLNLICSVYAVEKPHSRFWGFFLVKQMVKMILIIDKIFEPLNSEDNSTILLLSLFYLTLSGIEYLITLYNTITSAKCYCWALF